MRCHDLSSPGLDDGLINQNCKQHEQRGLARRTHVAVVVLGGEAGEAKQRFKNRARKNDDDSPNEDEKIAIIERFVDVLHRLLADDVADARVLRQMSQKAVV